MAGEDYSLEEHVTQVLNIWLAEVDEDDMVRSQAVCDQLAAHLNVGLENLAGGPGHVIITVVAPGQIQVDFVGPGVKDWPDD
jgi:hypothetical protein